MNDKNENPEMGSEIESEKVKQPTQEELDAKLDQGPSLRDVLRAKADQLGISYSPNIGEETLQKRIEEALEKNKKDAEKQISGSKQDKPAEKTPVNTKKEYSFKGLTKQEILAMDDEELKDLPDHLIKQAIRVRQREDGMRLIRCAIYNNDPAKNELKGDIYSVSNKYIGVVKKYIPFGGDFAEQGYHIPKILLEMLENRKYLQVKMIKNSNGTERVEQTLAPEFTIRRLPPLSKEELKEIAVRQQTAASVGFMGA